MFFFVSTIYTDTNAVKHQITVSGDSETALYENNAFFMKNNIYEYIYNLTRKHTRCFHRTTELI